jgi:uncharacterized membrane protein YGL010W
MDAKSRQIGGVILFGLLTLIAMVTVSSIVRGSFPNWSSTDGWFLAEVSVFVLGLAVIFVGRLLFQRFRG